MARWLKDIMSMYNKQSISHDKSVNVNKIKVYRFVSGDYEQLDIHQIQSIINLLDSTHTETMQALTRIIEQKKLREVNK